MKEVSEEHHPGSGVAEEGAVLAALALPDAEAIRQGILQRKKAGRSLTEGQGQLAAAARAGRRGLPGKCCQAGMSETSCQSRSSAMLPVAPPEDWCASASNFTHSCSVVFPKVLLIEPGDWHTPCMLGALSGFAVCRGPSNYAQTSRCSWFPYRKFVRSLLMHREKEEVGCRAHGGEHRVCAERVTFCGCALSRKGRAPWAA